jgi:hypothetical protein
VLRRIGVVDDGGDHVGLLAEPIDASVADGFAPLRLADVRDIDPGHDA